MTPNQRQRMEDLRDLPIDEYMAIYGNEGRKRVDHRTRKNRKAHRDEMFELQMDAMADAYLVCPLNREKEGDRSVVVDPSPEDGGELSIKVVDITGKSLHTL